MKIYNYERDLVCVIMWVFVEKETEREQELTNGVEDISTYHNVKSSINKTKISKLYDIANLLDK